jgi:hypothetical protein
MNLGDELADSRRMPQLNAEVTDRVKKKLADLERRLAGEDADAREIVAVLILSARVEDFSLAALKDYRVHFQAEKARRLRPKAAADT